MGEQKKDKKGKPAKIRKKGLIIAGVLFVLIVLLLMMFIDPFMEKQIEYTLSAGVGAKVEMDGFYIDLIGLKAGWIRLQVTDPANTMENIVETGAVSFDIAAEPLLYRKVVIEDISLNRLMSGTPRAEDGRLDSAMTAKTGRNGLVAQAAEKMIDGLGENTGINLKNLSAGIDIDNVLKAFNVESVRKISELNKAITGAAEKWKGEAEKLDTYKGRMGEIRAKIEAVKPEGLRDVSGFLAAANQLKAVRDDIKSVTSEFTSAKEKLSADISSFRSQAGLVDDWIKADISRAAEKARLPDMDVKNIAFMLFGNGIEGYVEKGMEYTGIARNWYERFSPTAKVKKPPRFHGQDIPFANKKVWPDYWIKKIDISSKAEQTENTNGLYFSGNIADIASDQKKTGKPITAKLSGGNSGRTYDLQVSINHISEKPQEKYSFSVSGISLKNAALPKNSLLPEKAEAGILDVNSVLSVSGNVLDCRVEFSAHGLKFTPSRQNDGASIPLRMIRELFSGLDAVRVTFTATGSPENLKISLSSNLDKLVSQRLKAAAGGEIEKQKRLLEERVKERAEPEKQKLEAALREHLRPVESQISSVTSLLEGNTGLLNAKKADLEKRIDSVKNPLIRQALKTVKQVLKW